MSIIIIKKIRYAIIKITVCLKLFCIELGYHKVYCTLKPSSCKYSNDLLRTRVTKLSITGISRMKSHNYPRRTLKFCLDTPLWFVFPCTMHTNIHTDIHTYIHTHIHGYIDIYFSRRVVLSSLRFN